MILCDNFILCNNGGGAIYLNNNQATNIQITTSSQPNKTERLIRDLGMCKNSIKFDVYDLMGEMRKIVFAGSKRILTSKFFFFKLQDIWQIILTLSSYQTTSEIYLNP